MSLPSILQVESALGSQSLIDFVALAWPQVFPDRPFVRSWACEAVCEHLEAVERDEIQDLLVTAPPRQGKSNTICVFYPVWAWVRKPWLGWIFDANKMTLCLRDALLRRQLMESRWFQQRWRGFSLMPEQQAKSRVMNSRRGAMIATSVDTSIIGEGGDRIVADDLHDPQDIDRGGTTIELVVNHWTQTISTRRNKGAKRILTQQRVDVDDVAGDCIRRGYVHLNLPQEFDPEKRCKTFLFEDPRQEAGELLNPELFNAQQNQEAKETLDEFHYAAQHQQEPVPKGGRIIKEEWLQQTYTEVPARFDTVLFSLDCAFKDTKSSDFVAGTVWGVVGRKVYLLPFGIHARLSFSSTVEETLSLLKAHPEIKAKVVEEKANGSAVIDTLRKNVPGVIGWDPGNNSKLGRCSAVSYRFRAGDIILPHENICSWVAKYKIELTRFPKMRNDDWVDSTSMALLYLESATTFVAGAIEVAVERGRSSPWTFEGPVSEYSPFRPRM